MRFSEEKINFVKKEFENRFNPEEEYLGSDKPVNKIAPLVSIVVATYQHADYVKDCLTSLLEQEVSFTYEILVGEDGSNDGTRELCKTIAELNQHKIRLFLRDRSQSQVYFETGEYLTRFNISWLLKSARGKFVAFCEGDDYWIDKNKLEKQIEAFQRFPNCVLCFHPSKIENVHSGTSKGITCDHYSTEKEIGIGEMILGGGHYCPTASVMVHTKILKELQSEMWVSLFPVGDYYLQTYPLTKGNAIYLPDIMSAYRVGVKGSWNQDNQSNEKKATHIIEMLYSNRFYDKKLNRKYHAFFKEKENRDIKRSFKNTYVLSDSQILQIHKIINMNTSGILKLKCKWVLFQSFLYYRFGLNKFTKKLHDYNLR